MAFNLNQRKFQSLKTDSNGEVSSKTIFNYFQEGDIIWANYQGGEILKGFLLGKKTSTNEMIFNYQHINGKKQLMTGNCKTILSHDQHGKIILDEQWQWTCNDKSKGKSTLIEI